MTGEERGALDLIIERLGVVEELVKRNAVVAKKNAADAAAHAAAEAHAAANEVQAKLTSEIAKERAAIQRLQDAVTEITGRMTSILESLVVLQRNSLRTLGAGSLLGGIVIFILSRALGL